MADYRVTWEIDIEADNPAEAARAALAIQRKHDGDATVFSVFDEAGHEHRIDLTEIDEGSAG